MSAKIDEQIKTFFDSADFREKMQIPKDCSIKWNILAQGEYNLNILFRNPISNKQLILRVNYGSQMHLKNQIEYEYKALKLLEGTGHTPHVYMADSSQRVIPHGVLVMEFLEGRALDYREDMDLAAKCLADIHGLPIHSLTNQEANFLLSPRNSLAAILDECKTMFKIYEASELGEDIIREQISRMLDKAHEKAKSFKEPANAYKCCINTELNNTNFLINGIGKSNYLIDWEKPLYGLPAQDLGHFLAPTTTFWKTDVILDRAEVDDFISQYIFHVSGRFDTDTLRKEIYTFIPITCMRGITWCAMALIQYMTDDKGLKNESTRKKLDDYISIEFLDKIEREYLCN